MICREEKAKSQEADPGDPRSPETLLRSLVLRVNDALARGYFFYSCSAMMILPSFLFLLGLMGSFTGWGFPVRALKPDRHERFGAGVLVVFFLVSAAGWLGILHPIFLWAVLLFGMVLWVIDRPGLPLGIPVIAAILVLLPLASLPPASRDAMIHHLYLPRLWLENGGIVRPSWSIFFSYPYLTETVYSLVGGTVGFRMSRVVSLLGFAAACSVPSAYFYSRGRKLEGALSVMVMMSIPELFRNATFSYSDSFLVFFTLLAYAEAMKDDSDPIKIMTWSAAAAACKYNGLVVVTVFVLFIALFAAGRSWKTLAACAGAVLFVSAWWAVPNLVQWGNPVYPLLRGLFGPHLETGGRAASYFAASVRDTMNGALDYMLLPLRISIHGEWDDPALFDGASGPLLLAGSILGFPLLAGKRRKYFPPLAYLVLALVFLGQHVRTRYLLPGLTMLVFPVTETLGLLLRRRGFLAMAALIIMLVCMYWSVGKLWELYSAERPLAGRSDEDYLSETLPFYDFYVECGNYVERDDGVLMLNLGKPFYFPGYAVFEDLSVPMGLLEMFWSGMGSDEAADSLSRAGITMVAADMFLTSINVPTVLREEEADEWRRFIAVKLEPLFTRGNYVLFRLRPDFGRSTSSLQYVEDPVEEVFFVGDVLNVYGESGESVDVGPYYRCFCDSLSPVVLVPALGDGPGYAGEELFLVGPDRYRQADGWFLFSLYVGNPGDESRRFPALFYHGWPPNPPRRYRV